MGGGTKLRAVDERLGDLTVAVVSGAARYPTAPPFHPPELFPELEPGDVDPDNEVFRSVREALRLLGLDAARFGEHGWNPLAEIVRPGDRVVLKPNFVLHYNAGGGPLEAVVTHPSVLRAVAEYVLLALGPGGELVIGDAPQMNCDWAALRRATGLGQLCDFLAERARARGVRFRVVDFRDEQTTYRFGIVWKRTPLPGSGGEPVEVTLRSEESWMEEIDAGRLYGADYDRRTTVGAHVGHAHSYVIAPEVLDADVVISLPKLKVHRKVGTTLNLKNMVGVNADKNHLAHYRVGAPADGGDEFSAPRWDDRVERTLTDRLLGRHWRAGRYPFVAWKIVRKVYRLVAPVRDPGSFSYGNWHRNDTAWRMALDLNNVVFFGSRNGRVERAQQRRYLSLVDGVVGGDGEGPLHPDAVPAGVVVAGFNPVAVDWVATHLMGFRPEAFRLYENGARQMAEWVPFDVGRIAVRSNVQEWETMLERDETIFRFAPSAGWKGSIERYDATPADPLVSADVDPLAQ